MSGDISLAQGGVVFAPGGANGGVDIVIHATSGQFGGAGNVTVFADGSHVGTVSVTSHVATGVNLDLEVVGHVGGVFMATASQIKWLWLNGSVGGGLGAVHASGMGGFSPLLETFLVKGDLVGDLDLIDRADDADVRIPNLKIERDIAGGVTVNTESGGIGQMIVEGSIGSSGDPVAILSGRDITSIETGEMFANIVAMRSDGGVNLWGNIRQLRVQKDFQGSESSGNFVGTIHANSVGDPIERSLELVDPPTGPQIEIQGDLGDGATLTYLEFESALDFDETFQNAQIVVGGAFRNNATIEVPAGGLEGQIIFNHSNSGAAWQSNAKVIVGNTELDTTQYAATAASIGGGAAGRAEYRLHSTSCDPAEVWSGNPPTREPGVLEVEGHLELDIDGTTWECVVDEATVFIQFYGPVSISTEAGAPARPVKVHKWDGDSWELITAFSISEAAGGDQKRLALTLTNEPLGGSYRVTREPGGLLSNEVDEVSPGTPAGVNAFTYYFDVVGGSCESMLLGGFDLNSDQSVSEPGDMPAWLVGPVDYNNDAATDSADVQLLQSAAAMYGALPGEPEYFPGPFVEVE